LIGQAVLIALLTAGATAAAMLALWRIVLVPDLERRARALADEATRNAAAEVTAAGEALVPQFRQAVRDGIQDAVLSPPTDRIGQTARGVTSAGVNVVESSLRRIFRGPTGTGPGAPPRSGQSEADDPTG
jgi:hypothetical protein